MKRSRFALLVMMTCLLATGCEDGGERASAGKGPRKELLIYCGITMIRPMSEIAEVIEAQENCKIIITKGGSGNLLRSIEINKVGDLFLPGSESYIRTCMERGLVTESVHVGYNKAAMMVQKGNPQGITPDLDNLAKRQYRVLICNPDSGSIGRETEKILSRRGIFEDVQRNALSMTTDSKNLALALKEDEADIVINWFATSTWPENSPHMDVLPIDEEFAAKKKLVLGLLSMSKYPEIARKFMAYAASEQGREAFRRYGLFEVQ